MMPRRLPAKPLAPKAAAQRITGQGIWDARRAKDRERLFIASAKMVAHVQSADTPTGQPPTPWRAAFELAKNKQAGLTYLKQFDMASVEAPKGVISYCATPEAAEKVLRAYRPVGGSN
jgi:hypothetical protein